MLNWIKKTFVNAPQAPQETVATEPVNESSMQADLLSKSTPYKNRGDEYLNQGRFPEAAECYRQAISISPSYAEAYSNLGNALREQELYEDAERSYKQALLIKPELANAHYNLGSLLQDQGKLDEAIGCYRKVLELRPDYVDLHFDLGELLQKQGKLDDALACYQKALALNPGLAKAQVSLGNTFKEQGRPDEAIACYRKALALKPDAPEVHYNLGVTFKAQGKLDEAIACYRKALALKPDFAEAHSNLGNVFLEQRKLDEAVACYNKALAIQPDYADAHVNLGNALKEQGNLKEAMACYQKALAINPDFVEAYFDLGNIFKVQGNTDKAMASYQKSLSLRPDYTDAHVNMGNLLKEQGSLKDAMTCFQKALAIKPYLVEALFNLGSVLLEQGKLDESLACYQKTLKLKPDFIDVHYSLGVLFAEQGKRDEAISSFRQVLEHEPEHNTARAKMLHQLQQICEWKDLESHIQTLRRAVFGTSVTAKSRISPFLFLAMPGTTAEEQKRCAEKWVQSEYRHLDFLRKKLGFEFGRIPNKKITIGYLSADFHNHATARLMAEVFELHDRTRFQITAYSYGPDDGSKMRKRLEDTFDQFVDISDDTHENSARRIYGDNIDILVDIKGYTQNTRSGILALRPAPIQVNYLGYPGTMGADFVDYMIADRFIIPPEQREHYTENIVWLPDCYQPNDRTRSRMSSPTRGECGLPEEGIVFCCFNQTYKITQEVFDTWCRLLKAAPDSILWLLANNPHAEGNLKRESANRGVDPKRLVMAPILESEKHLARLQCADLFLDTVPVNAHTTCSDALWMGLPVITCVGNTFPARVAGSLLSAMGVPELITYNLDDYYSLAIDLATDKKKRKNIRNKIVANRDTAPLFDSKRFTRNLEAVYTNMMAGYAENNFDIHD